MSSTRFKASRGLNCSFDASYQKESCDHLSFSFCSFLCPSPRSLRGERMEGGERDWVKEREIMWWPPSEVEDQRGDREVKPCSHWMLPSTPLPKVVLWISWIGLKNMCKHTRNLCDGCQFFFKCPPSPLSVFTFKEGSCPHNECYRIQMWCTKKKCSSVLFGISS